MCNQTSEILSIKIFIHMFPSIL